jgi:DNA adenine methylase
LKRFVKWIISTLKAFLKWAGGKSKIASNIKYHFKDGKRLVEPFVGSGALFLNTSFDKYLLCDINIDLINLYNNLKRNPEELIAKTSKFFIGKVDSEQRFYELREKFNSLDSMDIEKSALFVYLNKHAFNGLCRYNRKGFFNVPYGRYESPSFPEKEMRAFSVKSQRAEFKCQNFEDTFKEKMKGDIIYCDPPYVPLSLTSSFTSYSKNGFNLENQKKLAINAELSKSIGIQCIISNHDMKITREMYDKSKIYEIIVQRNIASKSASRKKIAEIIAVF